MTHAAVECARVISGRFANAGISEFIAICGRGNNGGDGYAIARTLHSYGHSSRACCLAAATPGSDAGVMHDAARAMGLVEPWPIARPIGPKAIVIDAIFGTGLDRAPTGVELDAIRWINQCAMHGATVVSIDIPSGIDCDTGEPLGGRDDAVRATHTITMVAEKLGFPQAQRLGYLGSVEIVSIGGPPHA